MADNEKYYYIKLKDSYFEQDNIKVLESMKNGHIYSLIIIKLYLKASKTDGQLMMTQRIPYDPNNVSILANVIGHDVDHVKEAIRLGVQLDLIKIIDGKEIWMTEIQNMIGKSSTEADRIRLYRKKLDEKLLPESTDVQMYDKCTPEIEKEREIKKELKIDTYSEVSEEIISYLNEKTSSRFKATKAHKGFIQARLKEGFTKEDFFTVIDNKVKTWKGTEWEKYLRPSTLFNASKFQGYLNEKGFSKIQGNDVSPELQAKGVFRIENGKYFTERGTEFDPFKVTDNGCPF
jgi:uncharacterized phage protein (TIGR02220 family)/predicted phage replisome organizer